jgi:hypothetical protein
MVARAYGFATRLDPAKVSIIKELQTIEEVVNRIA